MNLKFKFLIFLKIGRNIKAVNVIKAIIVPNVIKKDAKNKKTVNIMPRLSDTKNIEMFFSFRLKFLYLIFLVKIFFITFFFKSVY